MKAANESRTDARDILDAVIGAGQAAVHRLGAEEILRFIRSQPDIVGEVSIDNVRGSGKVGASSGIVLFSASFDRGHGPETRELVLRHSPGSENRLFFEYNMPNQFRVQRALQCCGTPIPEPLWLDPDGRWLGVPGYVMVSASGKPPHPAAFIQGVIAEASPADREHMLDQIMHSLVSIHRTDVKAAGLSDFSMNAPGSTPMECCINWYWQTWEWVRLPNYERMVPVHRWLLDHIPPGKPEVMHGDCTLHNYLFDGSTLTAVLDWEMSALGRAEADLAMQCVGNALFAAPPGSGLLMPPSEDEWLARYRKAGGRELHDFPYFKKLAAYMIVIAISALQRNLPEEARSGPEPLLRVLWAQLEA